MDQQEMRESFMQHIREDPSNLAHRYVFADWLEENGFDDEAAIWHAWTPEAYEEAMGYLETYANECRKDVEDLLKMAKNYLESDIPLYLHFETPSIGYEDQHTFWLAYQTVTGIPVTLLHEDDELSHRWIRCGC